MMRCKTIFYLVVTLIVLARPVFARYYDPENGRFLQEDPVPSSNPYPYVDNNPINKVDPFGLMTEDQWQDTQTKIHQIDVANPSYGTGKGQYVCNTFAISAYNAAGIKISGPAGTIYATSVEQKKSFKDRGKLKPGDLVFFDYYGKGKISHIGIYSGTSKSGDLIISHMTTHGSVQIQSEMSPTGVKSGQSYKDAIVGFATYE